MKKFFDKLLILILVFVILSMLFSFFEPKLLFIYTKKNIVMEKAIINDLIECSNKYYDAIAYNKSYVLNEMTTIFNRKSENDIKRINEKYNFTSFYLIVKNVYSLNNSIYSCDVEIVPKIDNNKYDWNNLKVAKFVIKLNRDKHTFKIFEDNFNLD